MVRASRRTELILWTRSVLVPRPRAHSTVGVRPKDQLGCVTHGACGRRGLGESDALRLPPDRGWSPLVVGQRDQADRQRPAATTRPGSVVDTADSTEGVPRVGRKGASVVAPVDVWGRSPRLSCRELRNDQGRGRWPRHSFDNRTSATRTESCARPCANRRCQGSRVCRRAQRCPAAHRPSGKTRGPREPPTGALVLSRGDRSQARYSPRTPLALIEACHSGPFGPRLRTPSVLVASDRHISTARATNCSADQLRPRRGLTSHSPW
jgi:hypothetical protein